MERERGTLWYLFWPVMAYHAIGNDQAVLDLAPHQIAIATVFGELRAERGQAFEANEDPNLASANDSNAIEEDWD